MIGIYLRVEATQVVCVPCMTCLNSFFVEQSEYSWFDHACHDERAVPLGLQFALLVWVANDHHVPRVDVLS